MRRLRRPSPAMLVALVALVLATTGSAVAATLITGKNIKNGTIRLRDLSKGTRAALVGKRGKTGKTGKTGPRGFAGFTGASGRNGAPGTALAYAHINSNNTVDASGAKGIAVSTRGTGGAYCLNYTGGTAHNIQLTIDVASTDSRKARI